MIERLETRVCRAPCKLKVVQQPPVLYKTAYLIGSYKLDTYTNMGEKKNFLWNINKESGLPQTGTFRMFPTTGDSMLPVPEGADVICRYVEDWTMLKAGTLCIVILDGEQDFVFKKVTVFSDGKKIRLESLNRAYAPYEVSAGDVIEIWKFRSYFSKDVPERVSEVQHISTAVNEILQRLKLIEEKIEG